MQIGRLISMSLLAGAMLLLADNQSFAARLLTATVEVDGKVVLRAMLSDDGSSPPNVLWHRLGGNLLWEEESSPLSPRATNVGRVRLQGDVVIRIRHVDRILAQESPTELKVVRGAAGKGWLIPLEEMERIAPARVIPESPPLLKTSEIVGLCVFAVGGTVALVLGAWFILRQTQRRESTSPP